MPKTIRCNSFLPSTPETFGRLERFASWYQWLWLQGPVEIDGSNIDLLRIYASLIVESAIPHTTALDCLSRIHSSPIRRPYRSIEIPISRKDRSTRRVQLGLHTMTALAIRCWQERQPGPQLELDIRPNRLYRKIEKLLRSQFANSLVVWRRDVSIRFEDIQGLGQLIAIQNGAEPFMISILTSYVRPTSQSGSDPYFISDVSRESLSHMLQQHSGLTLRSQSVRIDQIRDTLNIEMPPPGWIAESRNLLRQLCRDLREANPGKLRTPQQLGAAANIIERYKQQAMQIAPADSALALALEYAKYRYIDCPTISAGSLRNYLDRAVINGLLDSEASYSLSDWDTDDFIENVENRLGESRLNRNSRKHVLDAYAPLLRFLCNKLNLPPISISGLREDYVAGSGQWALISPHAIDKVIHRLFEHSRHEFKQAAVIIALAYYGGLRASETRRLTLANIVFNDRLENLDVELLRGKSPNSRRRLPLASLAPPHIVNMIRKYWNTRRSEFRDSAQLSRIALFGAQDKREPYLHHSITRLTRQLLKQAFGESATLHMLRHCFCSFLFVRWYSLRYPEVLDRLRDRSHMIFQPAMQKKLDVYFACMPHEDGDIRPYDLVSMTKLTGHASPETLFQYYIHSFSFVQSHAVTRIKSIVADARLTDRLLSRLVPRMKSSASRARIQSKTIGGIGSVLSNNRPQTTATN